MANLTTTSAVPDLPPIPKPVQITIFVLLGTANLLVVTVFLVHFPLNFRSVFALLLRPILQLQNIAWPWRRIYSPSTEPSNLQPTKNLNERSIVTFNSPASTRQRPTFHSTADEDAAWSTSISPFPTTTPTPIRRYLSAPAPENKYTPSIYSPQTQSGPFRPDISAFHPAGITNTLTPSIPTSPNYEHYLSPSVYAPSPLEVRKKRKYVPERPHRHFDPGREFEVATPESQRAEKGSIVIGLGLGLSPLVGRSPVSVMVKRSVGSVRSGGTVVRRGVHGGFATPLTDVEEDEKGDWKDETGAKELVGGRGEELASTDEEQRFVMFRFVEGVCTFIAKAMVKVLDSEVGKEASMGLLVSANGYAPDPFDED